MKLLIMQFLFQLPTASSQTPSIYVLPLECDNMFHTHTKQQVKLYCGNF